MAISQYGNDYYGLSGDNKPLGTPLNGRKFTEMDTGKEYRYDAENQQWLQQSGGGGGGGSSTLAGLTDVDISNPADGQVLVYDATAGKWVNGSAGGVVVVAGTVDLETYESTLNKTAGEILDLLNDGVPVFVHVPPVDFMGGDRLVLSAIDRAEYSGTAYVFKDTADDAFYATNLNDYPSSLQPD